MTADKSRRVSVRVENPNVLAAIEKHGVQGVLGPIIEAGSILKESGILDHLIALKNQGTVASIGDMAALLLAIDFCKAAGQQISSEYTYASEKPGLSVAETKEKLIAEAGRLEALDATTEPPITGGVIPEPEKKPFGSSARKTNLSG